jgi:two-component system chemotaxis response regulator CheV
MKDQNGILLESGTNEVEILEFQLDGQGFGLNVLKVQAIEQFDQEKVTEIQLAHRSVIGTYSYRDGVITLVDLAEELEMQAADDADGDTLEDIDATAVETVLEAMPGDPDAPEAELLQADAAAPADPELEALDTRIVLVLEFNERTTGFLVDGVNRIHRVSWSAISSISPYLAATQSKFTGSLAIEQREVLLVDMERILADIIPVTGEAYHLDDDQREAGAGTDRAEVPVFLAEDSPTIRGVLEGLLKRGGYEQVHAFDNGLSCYDALQRTVEQVNAEGTPLSASVGVVISDIEMPQMDGMTLCRRVKTDLGLKQLPVILFSSLINEQIAAKCESVGADGYISKPRFAELMELVDRNCLVRSAAGEGA